MLKSNQKRSFILYGLSVILFFTIAIDYFGENEVRRSTKVAFFALGAGLLGSGIRFICSEFRNKRRKRLSEEDMDRRDGTDV